MESNDLNLSIFVLTPLGSEVVAVSVGSSHVLDPPPLTGKSSQEEGRTRTDGPTLRRRYPVEVL